MKLYIYNEKVKREEEIYLKFEKYGNDIFVVAADQNGVGIKNLLSFNDSGIVFLYPNVYCGAFQTEGERGYIKTVKATAAI